MRYYDVRNYYGMLSKAFPFYDFFFFLICLKFFCRNSGKINAFRIKQHLIMDTIFTSKIRITMLVTDDDDENVF